MNSRGLVAALFAAVALPLSQGWAGTYYVKIGGSDAPGNGTDWSAAFGTIDYALAQVKTAGDTNATIYVKQTGVGENYVASSEIFTNTCTVRILGGYAGTGAPGTRDGKSTVAGSGDGISLMVSGGAVATPFVGTFVIADFTIATGANGVSTSANASTANNATIVVSNCTVTTTSATAHPIYLAVLAGGGLVPSVTVVDSLVYTPAGNNRAAVKIVHSNNATIDGLTAIINSVVLAAADSPTTLGRVAAVESYDNTLLLRDSAVTNNAAGYGVAAGDSTYGYRNHQILHSTVASLGRGVVLNNRDFSPSDARSLVADSQIVAVDLHGLYLYGWHYGGSDAGVTDFVISNSTITASGADSVGVHFNPYNGGALDIQILDGSRLYGKGQALLLNGGGGNRGNDTLLVRQSVFSAGAADGGDNSTNAVVLLDSAKGMTASFDRALARNGAVGINLDPGSAAYLYMVNCAITDLTGYGARLDSGGSYVERLYATNCTFSAIGGACLLFGDNGTSTTLAGTFRNCAFAPGGSATNVVSLDVNRNLALDGANNAFHVYGTFSAAASGGGVTDGLTGSILAPGVSAGLAADGYHLAAGSPLLDKYTIAAADPATDIDGDTRSLGDSGDIGCDEAMLPSGGTLILVQ